MPLGEKKRGIALKPRPISRNTAPSLPCKMSWHRWIWPNISKTMNSSITARPSSSSTGARQFRSWPRLAVVMAVPLEWTTSRSILSSMVAGIASRIMVMIR